MKNLNEIDSADKLTYPDYLEYKSILTAKNTKLLGKKECLYLLPILIALASFGLLKISTFFLFLSIPAFCFGMFFAIVAAHSIYANFCKRADNKAKRAEYNRLKKSNQLSKLSTLIQQFEKLDKFGEEKLKYEIASLKQKIKASKSYYQTKEINIDLLEQELKEKEYLQTLINKQKLTKTQTGQSYKPAENEQNLTLN